MNLNATVGDGGVNNSENWETLLGGYCNIQVRDDDGLVHSEGGRGAKTWLHFGCFEGTVPNLGQWIGFGGLKKESHQE